MLTKNQRTHYILLTDGTEINVTKVQAEVYESEVELKQHNKFIKIHDIDTDEVLFHGRCSEIKRFIKRKQDQSLLEKRFVCSYGNRHPISQGGECDCKQLFGGVLPFELFDWLIDKGYNINYPSDITKEMQREFINNYELGKQ